MIHPIECSDEYGTEGIPDANDLAKWLNSWMRDLDVDTCTIKKVLINSLDPVSYTIAPAPAGE